MTTEILTDEQVGDLYLDWYCFFKDNPGSAALCIRAIEQAVLQSPEIQALIDVRVREALELAADTCAGIAIPTSHDAPNKQVALECALAIRALLPSTPARPESEQ